MFGRRGLILLSVTIFLSCAGGSLDAVTGGYSGVDSGGAGGTGAGGGGEIGSTGDAGTGGAAKDGPADIYDETAAETGGGDFCAPYVYQSDILPGVSASDFCAKVATICMFGADTSHYSSMSDCLMKYGAASSAGQSCRAGYLCNRTKTTFVNPFECDFAAGGGPCGAS